MSALVDIVYEEARDVFPGRFIHLDIRALPGRFVAIIEDQSTREALAMGVGADSNRAYTALLSALQAREFTLSADDTAAILGVARPTLRQWRYRGTFAPVTAGSGPNSHRYLPTDVGRRMGERTR